MSPANRNDVSVVPQTPGSAERVSGDSATTEPSKLVERLHALKTRLSDMTKTLEDSVATVSPLRGKSNEEIVYSTPKFVAQLLDAQHDSSLFLAPHEDAPADSKVIEVRFTLAASSDQDVASLLEQLELQSQGMHSICTVKDACVPKLCTFRAVARACAISDKVSK